MAQDIIRLFRPNNVDPLDRMRTSLQRLARSLDADPESVRNGVLLLVDEGDFAVSRDVATLHDHQVFELTVDWEKFTRTRIGIRHARSDDPDDDHTRQES